MSIRGKYTPFLQATVQGITREQASSQYIKYIHYIDITLYRGDLVYTLSLQGRYSCILTVILAIYRLDCISSLAKSLCLYRGDSRIREYKWIHWLQWILWIYWIFWLLLWLLWILWLFWIPLAILDLPSRICSGILERNRGKAYNKKLYGRSALYRQPFSVH